MNIQSTVLKNPKAGKLLAAQTARAKGSSQTPAPSQAPQDTVSLSSDAGRSSGGRAFATQVMGGALSAFPAIGGLMTTFSAAGNLVHGNRKGAAAGIASAALNFTSLVASIDRPQLIVPALVASAGAAWLGAYSWQQLALATSEAESKQS